MTPEFTECHFEFFASMLRDCRTNPALSLFAEVDPAIWRKLDMHFAARLCATNPSFDIYKFLEACGPEPIKKKKKTKEKERDPYKRPYKKMNDNYWGKSRTPRKKEKATG